MIQYFSGIRDVVVHNASKNPANPRGVSARRCGCRDHAGKGGGGRERRALCGWAFASSIVPYVLVIVSDIAVLVPSYAYLVIGFVIGHR